MEQPETIDLFYRKGTSDKVYRVELLNKDGGWVVIGWNARRGFTLMPHPKTDSPLPYDDAKRIYDNLIRSKLAKGYKPSDGSVAGQYSAPTTSQKVDTGIYPELPIPIKDATLLELYFTDPNYWMQPKRNGQHRILKRDNCDYIGINKKGFQVPISDAIKIAMSAFKPLQFVMDGEEEKDEKIIAFDLLSNGRDYRDESYERRLARLAALFESANIQDRITLIETAKTEFEKRALATRLRSEGQEGVVIKDKRATSVAGESGNMFKFQFRKHVACIVTKVNQKNSIAVHVLDGDRKISIGNVTVYPNTNPRPRENDIVEVEYLFANRGGSLEQPVLRGVRTDCVHRDCRFSKLQFKGESSD